MTDLLQCSRIAFRRLHGLALDNASVAYRPPVPDEPFFRQAVHHRIAGLLSAELFPEWKSYAYGQALYSARCTEAAEQIYGALRETIPSLGLIKGSALAAQSWPQPGLRHYDDLDFRCAFMCYGQLRDALSDLGYRPDVADDRRQAHLWHFGWGVAFVHEDGPRLECNHRMFPPHYPWPARLDGGRGGAWMMQQLDQQAIVAPSPPLHLLICCMHAVWHGWERLAWIADIAGLLVTYPDAYAQAHALAGRARFPRRALDTASTLANRIFGPLPEADAFFAASAPVVQNAFHKLSQARCAHGFAAQRRFHHAILCLPGRIDYTLRRLLIPGDADFRRFPLPAAMPFAYWLLRPWRLLFRRWGMGLEGVSRSGAEALRGRGRGRRR